jgi:hypothetical protein
MVSGDGRPERKVLDRVPLVGERDDLATLVTVQVPSRFVTITIAYCPCYTGRRARPAPDVAFR